MFGVGIAMIVIGVVGVLATVMWIIIENRKNSKPRKQNVRKNTNMEKTNPTETIENPNIVDEVKLEKIEKADTKEIKVEKVYDLTEGLIDNYPTQNINHTEALKQEELNTNEEKVNIDKVEVMICSGCNSIIEGNVKFCSNCGAKVERIKEVVCPGCNNIIKDGAKFCSECGSKINF